MLGITLRALEMLNQIVFCCLSSQLRLAKIWSGGVNVLNTFQSSPLIVYYKHRCTVVLLTGSPTGCAVAAACRILC